METVPTQTVTVIKYAESETRAEDNPDAKAWVVNSKLDPAQPFSLWVKEGYEKEITDLYPDAITKLHRGGFVSGRAMVSPAITTHTVGGADLPEYLWRATHDEQPFEGIKSRGRVGTNPVYFAIQFYKHCFWQCRYPSPFTSWTDDKAKAVRAAARYEAQGKEGINLVRVRTTGPAWDRERQRIWSSWNLIREFDFKNLGIQGFRLREFVIEDSVPTEYIHVRNWDDIKRGIHGYTNMIYYARRNERAKKKYADWRRKKAQKEKQRAIERLMILREVSREQAVEILDTRVSHKRTKGYIRFTEKEKSA